MANAEYVKCLKHDVKEWNQWRMSHLDAGPALFRADLRQADLYDAHLLNANLADADLFDANLSVSDLREANLSNTSLFEANLGNADLRGANFNGSDLRGANLTDAQVGWTVFGNVDLSTVKGLEKVRHLGPSTIGIDTMYRSKGQIPEAFLRGAGVPDSFIVQMKALVGALDPIQFYSCFISYSSKDQDFAERMHADLQAKGVRCWFAPEDLKIGDKFRPRIDEAIRVHDKLLLLLSGNSIESNWVETEVETALEREHREKRAVLFPIRLDEAVMETAQAWAASIRRTRHIGAFQNWKDHDAYKRAFDRLRRDLKDEAKTGSGR